MRNFFWNLVQRIFQSEIKNHAVNYHLQVEKDEESKRILMNYPIGKRIISQSNEPDELLIGNVVAHEVFHHGIMIMVQNDAGQRFTLCDNAPALWTPEREAALRKLSWDERWNAMSKNMYVINKKTKEQKEKLLNKKS